jgi:hypothetical protein
VRRVEEVSGEWEEPMNPTPPPLSTAPPTESAAAPPPPEADASSEFIDSFPEKWKQDFEGLAYLGYLEDTVRIPFHEFVIRTILPAEKLEIALICREFEGSIGYNRAYKASIVSAAIHLVDGQQLLVARKDAPALRQKYAYVVNTWYDPVIEILYRAVDALEGRQYQVMKALGIFNLSPPASS